MSIMEYCGGWCGVCVCVHVYECVMVCASGRVEVVVVACVARVACVFVCGECVAAVLVVCGSQGLFATRAWGALGGGAGGFCDACPWLEVRA